MEHSAKTPISQNSFNKFHRLTKLELAIFDLKTL